MNETSEKLRQWFDGITVNNRLSDQQVNEMAEQFIGRDSPLTREQFTREVTAWERKIAAAHGVGHSGEARRIGKEAVAILSEALGPLPPTDHHSGKSIAQIVSEIPR